MVQQFWAVRAFAVAWVFFWLGDVASVGTGSTGLWLSEADRIGIRLDLMDATIEALEEGLRCHHFTSMDLVKVRGLF
jgi:hypothetical protein